MRIKMWGVRGSIPSPGPETVEFGGNTSCYEVRCGDALIILDGGTGLRLLGQDLLKEMPLEAWMFFSHVHWDHIQGFPFFTPAFIRGNTFHLRGGVNVSRTLEETLAGQMDYPSFPVHLSEMGATMTFRDLYEGEAVMVGPRSNVKVTNARGNHPNGVYAYRIEYEGKSLVYITDSEHYAIVDPKLKRLAMNADVLIFDAMYTPEEYAGLIAEPHYVLIHSPAYPQGEIRGQVHCEGSEGEGEGGGDGQGPPRSGGEVTRGLELALEDEAAPVTRHRRRGAQRRHRPRGFAGAGSHRPQSLCHSPDA